MTTISAETEILVSKKTQGKTMAHHAKKAKKPAKKKVAKAKKPRAPKKEGAAKAGRKAKYDTAAIEKLIGDKPMEHKMASGEYKGELATCEVKDGQFAVKVGGKSLGLHPTLGAAAKALGQSANGMTFWHVKPYPKHAPKKAA